MFTLATDSLHHVTLPPLDGWCLLRDTWDLRRWDFDVVLTKLHAEFGVSPYFKVTVVPDPLREGHNIIKVRGGLGDGKVERGGKRGEGEEEV